MISFVLTSCEEVSEGNLKINRDFRFNPTSTPFVLKKGNYIAELAINSGKDAILKVYLLNEVKEIKFTYPKIKLPDKDNFDIKVSATEIDQNLDISAKVSTKISYSDKRFKYVYCDVKNSLNNVLEKKIYKEKLTTKYTTVKFFITNGSDLLGVYEGISTQDEKETISRSKCQ